MTPLMAAVIVQQHQANLEAVGDHPMIKQAVRVLLADWRRLTAHGEQCSTCGHETWDTRTTCAVCGAMAPNERSDD